MKKTQTDLLQGTLDLHITHWRRPDGSS